MLEQEFWGTSIPALMRDHQREENRRAMELLRDPNSEESRQYLHEIESRVVDRLNRRTA